VDAPALAEVDGAVDVASPDGVDAAEGSDMASGGEDGGVGDSSPPAPNIVFTTSTTHNADLGGLSGADDICAERAQAAGLAGTYRAWLSTSTVNAIDRLGNASGWVRPDGKPVLNSAADIASSALFYPPRLDEFGNDLGVGHYVMTATGLDGKRRTDSSYTTCGDFTSAVGSWLEGGPASSDTVWFTLGASFFCAEEASLYCFGIDRTAQVTVTPATGRHAFMTTDFWTPGGGLDTADSLCQSEATAAGLPGTYKALLASSGATAASRFDTSGETWIRSDGIPVTSTASAFFSASMFDVEPNMSANGHDHFTGYLIWSGAATMTTAGSDATTCGNWLSTSGTGNGGESGDTSATRFFGDWGGGPTDCSFQYGKVVCLQE